MENKMTQKNEAFQEGFQAYENGSKCPYDVNHHKDRLLLPYWNAGYKAAKEYYAAVRIELEAKE
jgi:hypothetical protein